MNFRYFKDSNLRKKDCICPFVFFLRAKKGRFRTFPWGTFQNIRRILHNFLLKIEVLWEKCVEKHKKRWRRISLHFFCKLQCFWEQCVAYMPHENVRKWHAKKKWTCKEARFLRACLFSRRLARASRSSFEGSSTA